MVGAAPRRRITILGATGSVGKSALEVIAGGREHYALAAVTARGDALSLARIAREFGAELAVVADPSAYALLKSELAGSGIEAASGEAALLAAAGETPADLVVAAIVGAAGLAPSLAALQAGRTLALANKEPLVCAGRLFMETAAASGAMILPVDSEHNAIFQAMGTGGSGAVERIILTGSGGPFRDAARWDEKALAGVSVAEALRHPNWSMGQKITIDSATLMNKGLEVIEAHHLFSMEPHRIEVLIHPQSAVHGIVVYEDGSMLAQMGAPDMRVPLAHCLAWPARMRVPTKRLDLALLGALTFEKPDPIRFPALRLALEALANGGGATNILNAANEIAVERFLAGRIGYLKIAHLVEETLERALGGALKEPVSLDEALALDEMGRRIAAELIDSSKRSVGGPKPSHAAR